MSSRHVQGDLGAARTLDWTTAARHGASQGAGDRADPGDPGTRRFAGCCKTTAAVRFRESKQPRTGPHARWGAGVTVTVTVTGREATDQPGGQGLRLARGRPRVSDTAWPVLSLARTQGHRDAAWLCPQGGARSGHNPGVRSAPRSWLLNTVLQEHEAATLGGSPDYRARAGKREGGPEASRNAGAQGRTQTASDGDVSEDAAAPGAHAD